MIDAFTPQHCYKIWEEIKRHPDCQKRRCIYVEVVRENVVEPYISICVRAPSNECRVGFRGAKPWRITGYHVAGMGSAVVICGNMELRVEQTCLEQDTPVNTPHVEPYGGPTSIAIRVWWDKCVRITFDNKSYCICPPQSTPSQQQVMTQQQGKRRSRGVVRWLREKVLLCLTRLHSRDRVGGYG